MNKDAFLELARQIMPLPTAPYHEQFVGEAIAAFAASRPRLVMSADDFGNLHLLYDTDREEIAPGRRRPRRLPRLVVTAHMDHPGMGFDKRISRRDFLFERLGGVPEDLTRNGEVDIYRLDRPADQKPIRGNISACVETAAGGSAFFKVRVARGDADEVGSPASGGWQAAAACTRLRRSRRRNRGSVLPRRAPGPTLTHTRRSAADAG